MGDTPAWSTPQICVEPYISSGRPRRFADKNLRGLEVWIGGSIMENFWRAPRSAHWESRLAESLIAGVNEYALSLTGLCQGKIIERLGNTEIDR